MTHHQIAVILFVIAAALMVVEWLLILTKRDALRLDLLAWAAALVGIAFLVT